MRAARRFWRELPLLHNPYVSFLALFVVAAWLYGRALTTGGLLPVEWALGGLSVALLVPSMWLEIRVFSPLMLALIPMGVKSI